METKESMIQKILDNNFVNDEFTAEGVMRVLPRRYDRYGRMYGWDDEEFYIRAFMYIRNIKGFKVYLKDKQIK
ncbi:MULTISPECIES: hypothetical protein [Lysinibacillus]|uniref:hypothetical protein n=1 Tax=Lysinibacillus TaxID=400634 RepID=UPI00214BDC9C|nr:MULTISPECIES: hypothetical protein [Lysinibacillus]UUV25977.1 hypothetical protein NP781_04980 [Lysinibacillus sp. FN11]UYB48850.1 hypothetical protein OCI51_07770 [Lysinibacillus capsici]